MNLDELKERRDVWPIILDKLPAAISQAHSALDHILEHPDLMQHLERKFRKGEAEHQRAWLTRSDNGDPMWLISESAEEILDFVLYQAMFLVLVDAIDAA